MNRRSLVKLFLGLPCLFPALGRTAPHPRPGLQHITQETYLLSFWVAGTYYYQAQSALTELPEGTTLRLQREPGNTHDKYAIEIFTESGLKLGYVPRNRNLVLARLMDAGKYLYERVRQTECTDGENCGIHARMYMQNL